MGRREEEEEEEEERRLGGRSMSVSDAPTSAGVCGRAAAERIFLPRRPALQCLVEVERTWAALFDGAADPLDSALAPI